jgi:methanogenic corrinoid protein MtbC1
MKEYKPLLIHPILDDLADPSRRTILQTLRSGAKSVMSIVEQTGLKQPNVSNHLAKMRSQGIVCAQRCGKRVYYRLSDRRAEELLDAAFPNQSTPPLLPVSSSNLDEMARRYFQALMTFDEDVAGSVVAECLTCSLSLMEIYVDIFQPAMYQVGKAYMEGKITEAHEHLVSNITASLVAQIFHRFPAKSYNGLKVILGAVSGNRHDLGLWMISYLLKQEGWKTYMLGSNVPTQAFLSLVRQVKPNLVIISCAQEEMRLELKCLMDGLNSFRERNRKKEDAQDMKIMLGGGYLNVHQDVTIELGADATSRDARGLMQILDAWFNSA